MAPQTSVSSAPAKGLPGQIVDGTNPVSVDGFIVDQSAGIAPGLALMRSTAGDWAARVPPTFVADDDSIITAHATVAANTTLATTDLNGAIGQGRIYPPSIVEIVMAAHADNAEGDWNITYEDADGLRRVDWVHAIANLAFTMRTRHHASRIISVFQPVQDGTGGSFKVGTTLERAIGKRDFIGVSEHSHKTLLTTSISNNEVYADEEQISLITRGKVWVTPETSYNAGDGVFVRATATGNEVAGAFRTGDTDSGDCALLLHARLVTSGSAAEAGQLEIDL